MGEKGEGIKERKKKTHRYTTVWMLRGNRGEEREKKVRGYNWWWKET